MIASGALFWISEKLFSSMAFCFTVFNENFHNFAFLNDSIAFLIYCIWHKPTKNICFWTEIRMQQMSTTGLKSATTKIFVDLRNESATNTMSTTVQPHGETSPAHVPLGPTATASVLTNVTYSAVRKRKNVSWIRLGHINDKQSRMIFLL